MVIISSTVRVGQKPPKEVIERIREVAKYPIVYTDDCPELTDEQLAEFRPVNGMTWEERAQAMREAGNIDIETDLSEEEYALIAAEVEEKRRDPSSVKPWAKVRNVLLTWDHLILEYDKNTLDILLNCIYTIVL